MFGDPKQFPGGGWGIEGDSWGDPQHSFPKNPMPKSGIPHINWDPMFQQGQGAMPVSYEMNVNPGNPGNAFADHQEQFGWKFPGQQGPLPQMQTPAPAAKPAPQLPPEGPPRVAPNPEMGFGANPFFRMFGGM